MSALAVRVLAALWLATFAASFVALQITEPAGEGFTRGLNRVAAFLTWQGGALVVAIACALVTRAAAPSLREKIRFLGYGPLVASLVILVAVVGIIAFRVLVQPNFAG
jgi:hypothetical protein